MVVPKEFALEAGKDYVCGRLKYLLTYNASAKKLLLLNKLGMVTIEVTLIQRRECR